MSERIEAVSARCLALVARYHLGERKEAALAEMAAGVEAIVPQLMALRPTRDDIDAEILNPVRAFLTGRHGHEAGARIYGEFLQAFETAGWALCRPAPGGGGDPDGPHGGRAAQSYAIAPDTGQPAHGAGEDIR